MVESVSGKQVMQGPFKGMRYGPDDPGPCYMPQLLGTYELELNDIIEDLLCNDYDLLINAGSSVGYFTVGLAMRKHQTVVAYEANEANHPKLKVLAEMNAVGGLIDQKGFCTPEGLQKDLSGAKRPLLVMDTDSGEDPLLDPVAVSALARATILVETHDFLVPDITADLVRRFEKTHKISHTLTRGRSIADLPRSISFLIRPFLRSAMREHRGIEQTWLLMTPSG
jgi:hypothetical protein